MKSPHPQSPAARLIQADDDTKHFVTAAKYAALHDLAQPSDLYDLRLQSRVRWRRIRGQYFYDSRYPPLLLNRNHAARGPKVRN